MGTNQFTVSNKIWSHKDMTDMPSICVVRNGPVNYSMGKPLQSVTLIACSVL